MASSLRGRVSELERQLQANTRQHQEALRQMEAAHAERTRQLEADLQQLLSLNEELREHYAAQVHELQDQLLAEMLRVGTTPPPLKYLFEQAGLGQNEGRQALTKLVHDGRAQRITEELFLATETLDSCKQAIRAHLAAGGEGTVAALKDAMSTSRKFAVPLLEYFDSHGVTKRDGDIRSAV
jgi:hypothetical protein